ncbi:MAG TPA: peptidoglycan DD-metalloendopeptidase family protein [Candidatus Sulfomarinibacteraceae bacterium]|nr:peptidoglycan DD-metalloendopeptidase family protein [Candidatus Sulfomarinibacteraceae bacterium]
MRRRTPEVQGWSRPPGRADRGGRGILFILILTSVIGGLFVAAPPSPASADDLANARAKQKALETQIAKQKAQVAALATRQAALSVELAGTKASLDEINTDLTAVRSQVVQMTVDVAIAEGQVDELDALVAKLDLQLSDVEGREATKLAELQARKEILAERIRLAYDTDRTTLLETVLSSDTFTDVLAEVSYHLDLAEQDRVLVEQIVADQQVLTVLHATVVSTREQAASMRADADTRRAELDTQLAALAAARDRLARLEAETERLLAEQQTTYEQMAKDKAALAKQIAASEKAEEALRKEIDRLVKERARRGSIPSKYNGTLKWPMAGTITQEYGCTGFGWEPPRGRCRHFHKGIDIAAPLYTPVRAAGPGIVVFAGANPYDRSPRAWIVIIAHAENLVTWYAHLDNRRYPIAVRTGEAVVTGEVIAYEGLTGRTTGPHLHWGVQFNGDFLNPRLFL